MTDKIPQSVLDLLRSSWRPAIGLYESAAARRADSLDHPSFYIHTKDADPALAAEVTCFTFEEARALLADNAWPDAEADSATSIAVNEHYNHALQEFLGDTYAAWARFQSRIEEARRAKSLVQAQV